MRPIALILRRTVRSVSKDEGVSSAYWTLLRDAASPLLRMRYEQYEFARQFRLATATPVAASAMPASWIGLRVSPKSAKAIRAATGGTR